MLDVFKLAKKEAVARAIFFGFVSCLFTILASPSLVLLPSKGCA